jgi:chorismate mutase
MSSEAIAQVPVAAAAATSAAGPGTAPTVPAPAVAAAASVAASPAAKPSAPEAVLAAIPAPGGVLGGRQQIDAVDAQIIELIQRRIEISRQIQAARLVDGGRRVDLRRETEVIARYTAGHGRPGTSIAMSLLELGRGRA